jgi:hypothetical protein
MPLPRWIAPANPRRVWALLAIGTILIGWRVLAAQGYLDWNARLNDKVKALTTEDRRKFNEVLGWLYAENGVDAHVELLPGTAASRWSSTRFDACASCASAVRALAGDFCWSMTGARGGPA